MTSISMKKYTISSLTLSVNKNFLALICQDVYAKKNIIEIVLKSELRDMTSIGMFVDIFIYKYFV